MGFFHAGTLDALEQRATEARTGTAERFPVTLGYGEGGVSTKTYPGTAVASYGSRLVPVGNPSDITAADAPDTLAEYTLALPVTAVVSPQDRFRHTETDHNGRTTVRMVEVVGTPGPHSNEVERLVRVTDRLST